MTQANRDDRPGWRGLHGVALVVLFFVVNGVAHFQRWPMFMLAPLVVYAALVALVPPLRGTFRSWRFGRVTAPAVAATLILAAGSSAVLLFFESRSHPDLRGFATVLPGPVAGSMLLFGVLFSVGNALMEEIIFRGILFDAAESQWGVWAAVGISTVLFALGHLHGYPPGAVGVMLAGLFGLGVAGLRVYTGGLGLPLIAHIVADATIFGIVADAGVWQV